MKTRKRHTLSGHPTKSPRPDHNAAIPQCSRPGCTATNLCNAHIVPKGFARDIRTDGAANRRLTAQGSTAAFPALGDYDPAILCADCDHQLGKLDNYAIETFRRFGTVHHRLGTRATLDNVDGDRIARFILSVLWRASISKRREWSSASLGPFSDRAGAVAFGDRPLTDLPEYQLIAYRYLTDDAFDPTRLYSTPTRARMEGLNTMIIALSGFRFVAKIDQRSFPALLDPVIINGKTCLTAFVVDYRSGADLQAIYRAVSADIARQGAV